MSKNNGKSHPLTAEDLKALRPITAGDFYWGHKHADRLPSGEDDPQDLMFHTVHHAAVRAGIAEEDDLYGFLNRVELKELSDTFSQELSEETEGPLVESTGT